MSRFPFCLAELVRLTGCRTSRAVLPRSWGTRRVRGEDSASSFELDPSAITGLRLEGNSCSVALGRIDTGLKVDHVSHGSV